MDEIKVYTIDEVKNILKVTKRTVYTYIYTGKLQAIKMGKYWRVTPAAIEAFLYGQPAEAGQK